MFPVPKLLTGDAGMSSISMIRPDNVKSPLDFKIQTQKAR